MRFIDSSSYTGSCDDADILMWAFESGEARTKAPSSGVLDQSPG